ncbi:hypothetical protein [Paenibacillus guangzhouensis]|uniref:hypothetical protein n=1 Tax=Paenibacillus guangzhouensis TaxID=1473112 RepID=UPI00187B60ED|nr:hypothetical protein [Paenibacillus guangzhouensis]
MIAVNCREVDYECGKKESGVTVCSFYQKEIAPQKQYAAKLEKIRTNRRKSEKSDGLFLINSVISRTQRNELAWLICVRGITPKRITP